jgi:hypothetical protein
MREQLPESHDSVMTIHAAAGTRRFDTNQKFVCRDRE